MLANKPLQYWEVVQRDISTQFNKGVNWILALSYHDLPFRLKPCFLYLSQFPEDWVIEKKRLIRMWIVEGFIAQSEEGEETTEDVGERYFEELVNRYMVQVSQSDRTGTGAKKCRLHDLMRDMCVLKAKEENFLAIIKKGTISSTILHSARRIAIHLSDDCSEEPFVRLKHCNPHLRSLICFGHYSELSNHNLNFIFSNFKLLRVLNIMEINLNKGYISEEIGNLIHLRYLGLRRVRFSRIWSTFSPRASLPASMGNLKGLNTLDFQRSCYEYLLPDVMEKFEYLRHVIVDRDYELPGMSTLRHLETLKEVRAKVLIGNNKSLISTNLRSLAIIFERREEVEIVLRSRSLLGHLRSLKMLFPFAFPDFQPFSGCHQLTKLEFYGIITEDLHSAHHQLAYLPPSLTKLVLWNSRLKQDPLCILEKLSNLRFLHLSESSFEGSKMVCSANGFPRLEILCLMVEAVEEWEIQENAMPCLKTLYVSNRLKTQPAKFLSSLQELLSRYVDVNINHQKFQGNCSNYELKVDLLLVFFFFWHKFEVFISYFNL